MKTIKTIILSLSLIHILQLGNAQFDEEQINKNADSVQQIEIPKPENDALLTARTCLLYTSRCV